MLGLYAHLAWWLCDLHLQCGSNICSVIYAKYVKSDTGSGHWVVILGVILSIVPGQVCWDRGLPGC